MCMEAYPSSNDVGLRVDLGARSVAATEIDVCMDLD